MNLRPTPLTRQEGRAGGQRSGDSAKGSGSILEPQFPHLCRGTKSTPCPSTGLCRVKKKAGGRAGPLLSACAWGPYPTQLLSPAWPAPQAGEGLDLPLRMAPVHGEHHGSAGEGQRKEHGGAEKRPRRRVQPVNHHPVARPQRRGPSSLRKDAPHNPSPRSETQPPSCPPSPLVLPPATHLHTLSPLLTPPPSIRPSAQGPPPAPAGRSSLLPLCPLPFGVWDTAAGRAGLCLDSLSCWRARCTQRYQTVTTGGRHTSIWVIKEGFRPRTCLVSATPCSVDMSVGPGSTAQGCWKGCFQRSFKPAPPGVLLRVDAPGGQGQAQQGSLWMPVALSWGQFHPGPGRTLHLLGG